MIKQKLLDFIKNFTPPRVLVFGDIMLDHYIFGKVDRISPEAPIPILEVEKENFLLGGAGGCVASLFALGALVEIATIYGEDPSEKMLSTMLEGKKISTKKNLCLKKYSTIVKSRLLSKKQQLLRLDYEKKFLLKDKEEEIFLKKIGDFSGIQALIISDYNKGTCSPYLLKQLLKRASKKNLFSIVDPAKNVDFSLYNGAFCIKPNRLEAEVFLGKKLKEKKDYLEAAEAIQKKTAAQIVALSLDREGLLIYQEKKSFNFFQFNQRMFLM